MNTAFVSPVKLTQDLEPGDLFEIGECMYGVEVVETPKDLPNFVRLQLSLFSTPTFLPRAPNKSAQLIMPFDIMLVIYDV